MMIVVDLPLPVDLFHCAPELITEDTVIAFVEDAIATRVQAESLVLELKRKNDGDNVIHAVAAMANTDGGLVIVGVAEDGSDPFVGVNQGQIDSIVRQLRALVPSAMPEVLPVALSAHEGKALLVLRISDSTPDRPVVVKGRVFVRGPGETIGARRSEIIALVNGSDSVQPHAASQLPMTVANYTMWPHGAEPQIEVRVHAMLWLPRHLAGISHLGSDALASVREALQSGPVPRLLATDHHRSHEHTQAFWDFTETRALRARYHVAAHTTSVPRRPTFEADARLGVSGRLLEMMVSTSITTSGSLVQVAELAVPLLREALLGGMCSAGAALAECAYAVDPTAPIGPITFDAWIGGSAGIQALSLASHWMVTDGGDVGSSTTWLFDPLQPMDRAIESYDGVVRHWLTLLLFGRGVIEFEDDVESLPKPEWWDEISADLRAAGRRVRSDSEASSAGTA